MAHSYTSEDVYTEYDESEAKLIEKWLEEHNYSWWQPTLCGNCCGMFDGYYRVNGIGGKWNSVKDKKEFIKFAKENNIPFDTEEIDRASINPSIKD